MTRREEIEQQASLTVFPWDDVREQVKFEDGFIEGAKWADATIVERLRELKSDYEKDLDAEPRNYERHIQLCSKISLIEKLILELEDK